jgi:hypothetical protein
MANSITVPSSTGLSNPFSWALSIPTARCRPSTLFPALVLTLSHLVINP